MDLDVARSKQRAAQQQAQKQPDGIARIGDRDPETGLYTVQTPDGGVLANGIKTYTAASNPGDVVVMFPRADGSIALDSEKGSPTIVPDIFNKPVPEVKKSKFWILYFSAGRLWVGGHQAAPEDAGAVYLYGTAPASSVLESAGGPGVLGYDSTSNLHVWGDSTGWNATYQTFPNYDYSHAVTFHSVTSASHKKYSTAFATNIRGGTNSIGIEQTDRNNDRSFPLGAGFTSYRSLKLVSFVYPALVYDSTVSHVYSSLQQVTIGYMEDAAPTFNQFNSNYSFSSFEDSYITDNETLSYSGTIPIPHIDRPLSNPVAYSGTFSCPKSINGHGPYSDTSRAIVYPVLNIQSIQNYPILCDRSSTYYIQESIVTNGSNTPVQKIYELRLTGLPAVISRNTTEPRFFGIRWDIRETSDVSGPWNPSNLFDNYKIVSYADQVFYYPEYPSDPTDGSARVLPVGHFKRAPNSVTPIDEFSNYPYFATFSGGQVVTASSSEINKAKAGGGYLQRQSVDVNGTLSDLGPAFCYPIPADAIIYHWSTTV